MGKKFANKFWNIARYILLKTGPSYEFDFKKNNFSAPIVAKLKEVATDVEKNINDYKFGQAAHILYDFIWHDFADKFIEETKDKDDEETKNTLAYLLLNSSKLLHPFMPFITETIWQELPLKDKKLLMIEEWPTNNQ